MSSIRLLNTNLYLVYIKNEPVYGNVFGVVCNITPVLINESFTLNIRSQIIPWMRQVDCKSLAN